MTLTNPPTPWDPTKLFNLATQLLDVCVSILSDAGLTVPESAYVSGVAVPTGACEQLVVGWARVNNGTPSGTDRPMPIKGQMAPRTTVLPIWVFRCLTDTLSGEGVETAMSAINPQSAAYDAQRIMSDAYTLHKGLGIAHAAGQLGADYGTPIIVGDATPLAASGGIGGLRMEVTYELA